MCHKQRRISPTVPPTNSLQGPPLMVIYKKKVFDVMLHLEAE